MTSRAPRTLLVTLAAAAALASALAGCGADAAATDDAATPRVDASTSTSTTAASPAADVTPAPAADPAPAPAAPATDAAAFLTADTMCTLDQGLECGLTVDYSYELPADLAAYEVPCASVAIAPGSDTASLECVTDTREGAPTPVGPLAAGTTVAHGEFTCTVLDAGVQCENTAGAFAELTPTAYRLAR